MKKLYNKEFLHGIELDRKLEEDLQKNISRFVKSDIFSALRPEIDLIKGTISVWWGDSELVRQDLHLALKHDRKYSQLDRFETDHYNSGPEIKNLIKSKKYFDEIIERMKKSPIKDQPDKRHRHTKYCPFCGELPETESKKEDNVFPSHATCKTDGCPMSDIRTKFNKWDERNI